MWSEVPNVISQIDIAPLWRYYWIAQMPDGTQIPQFDSEGKKFLWHELPASPVAITLQPFSKDLALKVRVNSKVAAMPIAALPAVIKDLGGGLLSGIDQRYHMQPHVQCIACGYTFPFNPKMKAECPSCHARDNWYCLQCQSNQDPLWEAPPGEDATSPQKPVPVCPICRERGATNLLTRIQRFKISAKGVGYDFQHWVRTGGMEFRVTRNGIIVQPYAKVVQGPEDTTSEENPPEETTPE